MIADGNFRLIGLKHIDITTEIDNIINSANDVLIICGYSFTSPKNYNSILKKIINSPAKTKHCIFPIDLFRSRDVNRPHAIELIKNGVSVSLEPNNHSKWLMSENEIYLGSANFTNFSIQQRTEVVAFKNFIANDPLKIEFTQFTVDSINRMRISSNRRRLRGIITRNERIISRNTRYIQRLNPSPKKVINTLNSISKVHSALNELLMNNYWLLNDLYYFRLTREVSRYLELLSKITISGNRILNNTDNINERFVLQYNEYCDIFTNKANTLPDIANDFIKSESELPKFTSKNNGLLELNLKEIQSIFNKSN